MAYIESAVVVYLRNLYYPEGFRFPLAFIPAEIYAIELGRELGTLVMIFTASWISGRDRWERFLHFCFLFGIWDLFYYFWLKLFLGWPESLLTWDVLFLIPIPWVGPILAPVLVSVALVGGSVYLLRLRRHGVAIRFSRATWTAVIAAGLLVIGSFLWNFSAAAGGRVPARFPWLLFGSAFAAGGVVFLVSVKRLLRGGGERRKNGMD